MKYIILQCKKANKALLEQTLILNILLKYKQILRGFWLNLKQYAILESHFNYFKLLRFSQDMNMYKQISLCLPLLFCSQLSLADWIDDSVKNVEAHTIKLREHIHQHPELGNMEFKTSELV